MDYLAKGFPDQSTALQLSEHLSNNFTLATHSYNRHAKDINPAEKQLLFRPKINVMPFTIYPQNAKGKSRQEAWEGLIMDTRKRNLLRNQMKIAKEEDSLKQCKFVPSSHGRLKEGSPDEVFQRMYLEAIERRDRQRVNPETDVSTPNPTEPKKYELLNPAKHNLEPLYRRLEEVISAKRKAKAELLQKVSEDCTFQPVVQPKSTEIASKNRLGEVVDRLLSQSGRRQARIQKMRQKYEAQLSRHLTFQPLLENNYICEVRTEATQRSNAEQYTFVPQINPISSLLATHKRETVEEAANRLTYAPLLTKYENLESLEEEAYEHCTFRPVINGLSRAANFKGILDRDNRPTSHECPAKEDQVEPDYFPTINPESRLLTAAKRQHSLDKIKKKFKGIYESETKRKQYEEIRDCTFKPQINKEDTHKKSVRKGDLMGNVSGFERFLRNIDRAKDMKIEKRRLQEAVFQLEKRYDERMKHKKTVQKLQRH